MMRAGDVAELLGVKPGTVRVLTHRGRLTVLAYVVGDFRFRSREFNEGDRYAVFDRAEAEALARSRGINFTIDGLPEEAAADELRITPAEVRILAAAGDLKILGRGYGGARYDVIDYAQRHDIELVSAERERVRREDQEAEAWRLRHLQLADGGRTVHGGEQLRLVDS